MTFASYSDMLIIVSCVFIKIFRLSFLHAIMSAIRYAFKRSATYFSRHGKFAICRHYQHQHQRRLTAMPLTQLSEEEQMIKDNGID